MQLEVLNPQKNLADLLTLLPYTMMDSATIKKNIADTFIFSEKIKLIFGS